MDKKKLHILQFQLKGISGRNMRGKLLQKRSTGKTTLANKKCSKHLQNIANIFSKLRHMLTYINLVISKILFILVLWDHTSPPAKTFLIFLAPPTHFKLELGGRVHAMLCQNFLTFWYWCAEKHFLLFIWFRFFSPSRPVHQYFCMEKTFLFSLDWNNAVFAGFSLISPESLGFL